MTVDDLIVLHVSLDNSKSKINSVKAMANDNTRHKETDGMSICTRRKPIGVSYRRPAPFSHRKANLLQGNLEIGCQWAPHDKTAQEKKYP